MAQEQNYQVNYVINVEATQGTKQVMAFADSVSKLTQAKASLAPAVQNIRGMMADIDRAFRTKSGKKRDYSFKMNIDTRGTEEKLTRVKGMLTEIHTLTKGINLVINAGQTMNSKQIKAQTKALIDKKALENQKALTQNTAAASAKNISDTQKTLTKAVGKINAALVSLEKGRPINIGTDAAKGRLNEILTLLGKIKTSTATPMSLKMNVSHVAAPGALHYAPYAMNNGAVPISKAQQKLQEKLQANQQLQQQRMAFKQQEAALRMQQQQAVAAARRMEREQTRMQRQQETAQRKALADEQRRQREAERQRQANAMAAVRNIRRQAGMEDSMYGSRRRAAINRLQYSRAPSLRNLPFAYMFNAWMMYGMIRKQVTEAVEYSNIMETAHSILKVADSDLTTFETRFGQMATRFAKPTREARKTLGRLGVNFTEYRDVYGKQIEQLRPLSEIFADLERKGASMTDMQAIFGKIGGNAAMMFIKNISPAHWP